MDAITTELWSNLQAIIVILLTGTVTVAVAYYGNEGRKLIKDRQIRQIIATAVLFAEQAYRSENGQMRKRVALAEIQKQFEEHGIQMDAEHLSALLEAIVFDELNRWKGEPVIGQVGGVVEGAATEPA